MRSSAGRVIAAVAAVAVVLPVPAGSVAAHGGGGSDATNYRTEVLEPGDVRLSWRVYGGDALVELTNHTGGEVIVAGYRAEPYLRFIPGDGVFENTRSPAAYLNDDRLANVDVPADADPAALPRWERVADGATFAWHDHRAHWMAPTDPPAVAGDRDVEHLIDEWAIPLTVHSGDQARQLEARGELWWIPSVSPWPVLGAVGWGFAAVLAAAVLATRPTGDRWPGLGRTVTLLVGLVAAANVVRTVDDLVAVPAAVGTQLVVGAAAVVGLAVITGLAWRGWRGDAAGFFCLAAAGVLTMLLFGAESTSQLTASQLATVLPTWVRRVTVAASWMIVMPTLLAAGLAAYRHSKDRKDQQPVTATVS